MRLFVTVLALFALLAPQAAQAKGPVEASRCARCGTSAAPRATHAARVPEARVASAGGPRHWRLHHIGRTDHASTNPTGGRIETFAKRDALTHGIAGDERYVFVTEPGIGAAPSGARVVALDRFTGREVAALPAPEGGFKLPFTLRVPRTGHLVVLDSGGFPPVGPPVVYDYTYAAERGFEAKLTRTVSFAGQPLAFAEDVEVLPTANTSSRSRSSAASG
jgi:hypothetical protein